MNKSASRSTRETEYDLLRVISLLGVIVIHVCAMQWRKLETGTGEWMVLHIYDMLCKFSVPVFFMISGRFMLDPGRHCTVEKMLKKSFHIVVVFIFWSSVYMLLNIGRVLYDGGRLVENKWVFVEFFTGEYHMWFLYTISGLYILTPLLRYIAVSKEVSRYYLALFLIFGSLLPFLEKVSVGGSILGAIKEKIQLDMAIGYSGYYLLGHWLRTEKLSAKTVKWLYISGIMGAVFTVIVTLGVSYVSGIANEELAGYLMPNVVLTSAAVYYFMISRGWQFKQSKWISHLAEASFGCYLVHPLILWVFEWVGLVPTLLHPVIMVPLLTGITLLLSLGITLAMKKVPLLRNVVL